MAQMRSPTSWLPVKLIFLTRVSWQSVSPTSRPLPVRTLIPRGGRPHSSRILTNSIATRGVSLAGFRMVAFPPAIAGPILWQTRFNGKLKGEMATTTPQGTRSVNPSLPCTPSPASRGNTSPSNRLASSPLSSRVCADRSISDLASASVFPSSALSVVARDSLSLRSRSAALRRMRKRSYADNAAIESLPFVAAARASSISEAVALGTVSITCWSNGLSTGMVSERSTH